MGPCRKSPAPSHQDPNRFLPSCTPLMGFARVRIPCHGSMLICFPSTITNPLSPPLSPLQMGGVVAIGGSVALIGTILKQNPPSASS